LYKQDCIEIIYDVYSQLQLTEVLEPSFQLHYIVLRWPSCI